MPWIMMDIEADGPIPGDYSMISFGAVVVEPSLSQTFSAKLKPISDKWVPRALAVSGYSRQQTLEFPDPLEVMNGFNAWVKSIPNAAFISDNNGFDWMFTCWYLWHFCGENPFGHSSTNLGSLYKGCVRNMHKNFKHLRKTKHTHYPLDDAKGNAEAMLEMSKRHNFNTDWR